MIRIICRKFVKHKPLENMNRSLQIFGVSLIALAMSGCSVFKSNSTKVSGDDAVKSTTVTSETPKQTNSHHHSSTKAQMTLSEQILDGEWTIAEVNGRKVTGEERPYITFSTSEKRIYGSNGCNIINGDYTIDDTNTLSFGNLLTTQRACADAPFEYEINQALDKVRTYSVEKKGNEYYLSLLDSHNHRIMTLRKHNMDFLNGAWRVKSIKGKKVDNDNVQLVIDIPELKLHGNTGCNILNGSLWIDPDKTYSIQFQQIGTTRMRCEEDTAKTETALLIALEEVESAKSDNGKIKMYDKDGNKLLELTKIE